MRIELFNKLYNFYYVTVYHILKEAGKEALTESKLKKLIYTYDYGDNWRFSITSLSDVQEPVDTGRLKLSELREYIKRLCEIQRPVLLAADGYNLVKDAGGVSGYCAFLKGINGKEQEFT